MKSCLMFPLLLAATPALAQNTLPQPALLVDTIPAPRDITYPGTMSIDVDATDVDRAILKVKQVIPVAKSGPMTLLFSKWLPGKHAPRGEIEKLAGLRISAGGKTIAWRRDNLDALPRWQTGRADRRRGIDGLARIIGHRGRERFQPLIRQPVLSLPRPTTPAFNPDFARPVDDQFRHIGGIEERPQRLHMMIENGGVETHRRSLSE